MFTMPETTRLTVYKYLPSSPLQKKGDPTEERPLHLCFPVCWHVKKMIACEQQSGLNIDAACERR